VRSGLYGSRFVRIRRRRLQLEQLVPKPLRAVICAIDSAKRSGCAIYVSGQLAEHREVDATRHAERAAAVQRALELAQASELPIALVLEVPYGGTLKTALSLTASSVLWKDTWLELGGSPKHVLERMANEWRATLYGSGSGRLSREHNRRLEQLIAARIVSEHLDRTLGDFGGDESAAICLGFSAVRSALLQRALKCQLKD